MGAAAALTTRLTRAWPHCALPSLTCCSLAQTLEQHWGFNLDASDAGRNEPTPKPKDVSDHVLTIKVSHLREPATRETGCSTLVVRAVLQHPQTRPLELAAHG